MRGLFNVNFGSAVSSVVGLGLFAAMVYSKAGDQQKELRKKREELGVDNPSPSLRR